MPDLFASPVHSDTSALFEATYDGECADCCRSHFEGELVGFVDDELCCESCYRTATA